MKAVICPRYGPPAVLALVERPMPEVKDGTLLVRVHATAATRGDARIRAADFPPGMRILARLALGFRGPRNPILGGVFAGQVVAVGANVTGFALGDRVFGMTGVRMGCYAEYLRISGDGAIAKLPDTLSYQDAAALPFGFTTAIDFLRNKAQLQKGAHLLIVGASGDVGSAAVQIGKALGAIVTAICSGANARMVLSLGADSVIDYHKSDAFDGTNRYDVVMDTVGALPVARLLNAVKPQGRLLLLAAGLRDMLRRSAPQGRRIISGVAAERADDLALVAAWTESGIYRPVIDSVFPLADITAAHDRVDTGHKAGSIVVTCD